MKPEYCVKIEIVDEQTGETIMRETAIIPNEKRVNEPIFGLEDLNEEAAEGAFWDLMRHFRNGGQQKYEAEQYPKEEDVEDDDVREGSARHQ